MPSISNMIEPWMEKAVEQYGDGETIWWNTQMMPNAEQNGAPMIVVVVWMPGIALDHTIVGSWAMPDPPAQASEENVLATMETFLDQMRAGRSELLAQASQEPEEGPGTPEPPPAIANGHRVPPRGGQTASGLYIPGR